MKSLKADTKLVPKSFNVFEIQRKEKGALYLINIYWGLQSFKKLKENESKIKYKKRF